MKKVLFLLLLAAAPAMAQDYSTEKSSQSVEKNSGVVGIVNVYDESTPLTLPLDGINFLGSSVTCARVLHSGVYLADCTFTASGGAGLTDGDYGDVTVGGTGTTMTIDSGVVSLNKVAAASANSKLVGSGAAGSGSSYSEITLGSGLTMTGTTLSSSGAGIADPGANGMLARTAVNTTVNRTLACANTACTVANGDGVAGAPTFTMSSNTTDPGGSIVGQTSTPGTVQTTANNYNVSGTGIHTKDALGTTRTTALLATNTTAAVIGTPQQLGPALESCGTAYNTTSTLSEQGCVRILAKPNSANPTTTTFSFDVKQAGGAYSTDRMTLSGGGTLTTTGSINGTAVTATTGNVTATSGDVVLSDVTTGFRFGALGASGGLYNNSGDGLFMLKTGAGSPSNTDLLVGSVTVRGNTGVGAVASFSQIVESPSKTLSTVASFTDTTLTIPANAIVLGVSFRITASITTVTKMSVGIAGDTARFGALSTTPCNAASLASGQTGVCADQMATGEQFNATAVSVRLSFTDNANAPTNPGAGAVRVAVHYILLTPPTS